MHDNVRLRPNTPMVIAEIVEDEVVLVNFDSGSYYSLGGSASKVWEALSGGASVDDVVSQMLAHYDGDAEVIAREVTDYLETLESEDLVVADGTSEAVSTPAAHRGTEPFVPPSLERFDDMRDMLLLDPIHEVDEAGWPHTRPDGP